ncbi:MAG: SDR family NAD(P)-dependent oxidoreductase [Rhizomicrobium sp.]
MTDIRFDGRVAIVTGAGRGLGRSYAQHLARRGAAVVINDLDSAAAASVADEILAGGGRAVSCSGSVADPQVGESLTALALQRFGRIDVVINNAGNQRNDRFERMSEADFDAVLGVHLKGAFHVTQPAYRAMLEQGYGRILFTSSASALFGNHLRANYAAAKAGVIGLMHSLAIEGARKGVLANAILPVAASRLGQTPADAMLPEWSIDDPRNLHGTEQLIAAMDPDFVTPLALHLVGEQCRSTHALWSAVAGRYARVFIGETRGWLAPEGPPPRPEDIAAHLDEIADTSGFSEPLSVKDEMAAVIARRRIFASG